MASLVDALGELPRPGWVGRGGVRLSAVGRERLVGLGSALRGLRRLTAAPLVDLVAEAERAVGLDIEVLSRPEHTASTARVHLDAFADVAARYSMSADRPTLSGFLAWLEAARAQERGLDAGHIESDSEAVQVLTIHAAKGLEWDLVAVPGLVESVFPDHKVTGVVRDGRSGSSVAPRRTSAGSPGSTRFPTTCAVTATGCPTSTGAARPTARRWVGRSRRFGLAGGSHAVAEERRLAYVAFTRARSAMLLSTHVWGATKKTVSVPSRFLLELCDALGDRIEVTAWCAAPEPVADARGKLGPPSNPHLAQAISGQFPYDPMGARRADLARVVDRLVARAAAGEGTEAGRGRWAR